MIAITDYGAGNIRSVVNILESFGVDYVLAKNPSTLKKSDGIILPGVGSFGEAAKDLERSGLKSELISAAKSGKPLLGICLGLQLLFDRSEESVGAVGLGLISGDVTLIKSDGRKIPHIGWTSLENVGGKLLSGTQNGEYFYFVHSYGAHAKDRSCVSATASYGESFDACIEKGNIFGCQFHPEKSSAAGRKIVSNFLKICGEEIRYEC